MYAEIMIGTVKTPMRADGATPYRFQQVCGEDLISFFSRKEDLGDKEAVETLLHLGYVMSMQAAGASEEDYNRAEAAGEAGFLEWMSQFDPIPSRAAWADILNLYLSGAQTRSVKKKETGPSTGK